MAENHVAANILMLLILMLGFMQGRSIKTEAFPDIEVDEIQVSVSWDGAGPSEVSSQLCLPVENAVMEVEGIEEITCNANDGNATIRLELESDVDQQEILDDVRNAVDGIDPSDFPDEADSPKVSKVIRRMELMRILMYGDVPEHALFDYAYRVKDDLLGVNGVNYVSLSGTRTPEILIEISPENLNRYDLNLSDIASLVESQSDNYPSGSISRGNSQILLQTSSTKTDARDFENISIKQFDDGTTLYLKDIATIRQALEDSDNYTRLNGLPSVSFLLYQQDTFSPGEMSATVQKKLEEIRSYLPEQIQFEIWRSSAKIFNSRLELLISNAVIGLILVFVILGLFLEIRLAFWVMLGLPISFIGSMIFLYFSGVSINMNSLFAFILVSGIVVDDAIVVGENIFNKREQGLGLLNAAIEGCTEMAGAVTFAILTTLCAFSPLLFIEGFIGDFVFAVPVVVIFVLAISLIESLFILPAHLSRSSAKPLSGPFKIFSIIQRRFDKILKWMIHKPFRWLITQFLTYRYASVSLALSLLFISFGAIGGGFISMQFFPKIQDYSVKASVEFPSGYSSKKASAFVEALETAGREIVEKADQKADNGKQSLDGYYTSVSARTRKNRTTNTTISVTIRLNEIESERNIHASELATRWRKELPQSPDIQSIEFESRMMRFGDDINLTLSHSNSDQLKMAVSTLKHQLGQYAGVKEINDSESKANPQFTFTITEEAKSLGISPAMVAKQLQAAFQGIDIFSIPKQTEDIDVIVLFPKDDREALSTLETIYISNSSGDKLPLMRAVTTKEGFEPLTIRRINRKRVIEVTGKFDEGAKNSDQILESIVNDYIPTLKSLYPGLSVEARGSREEQTKSMNSLIMGFLTALLGIYSLLAIYFKNYFQPIIVMIAIPFGLAGAVGGHYLLGHPVSFMSMFGIIGLSGVVVNDSLILVAAINSFLKEGLSVFEALIMATIQRFRPILLTSLTTFLGLAPILMEDSMDAQFLIPTAISLGIGILFTTFITLLIVPALYHIFYDVSVLARPKTITGTIAESVSRTN